MPKKFDFLINVVSTATHQDCLSPTSAMADLSDELLSVTEFKVLQRTEEYIALAAAIKTIPKNRLHSRQLALERLHEDVEDIVNYEPAFLIGAFTCLSRRLFIFNEMDRILSIKGTYSKDLVFDVAAVYVVLSTQESIPDNALNKLAKKEYEFSFEAEARKHWLEIMAIMADNYFAYLFTQLPEAQRVMFYKHWPVDPECPDGLWEFREDMIKQTMAYIENIFVLKLGNLYKRNLLFKMRDFPKTVVHKGLADLEYHISALADANDGASRSAALKYLHSRISLLLQQHNNFSMIYTGAIIEYQKFIDFEKKVKSFKNVLNTYQGPQCMEAINAAMDDCYYTYAKDGDAKQALNHLTSEVSKVRNNILTKQRVNLTAWFGMFALQNPVITLIDKALLAVRKEDEEPSQDSLLKARLLRV